MENCTANMHELCYNLEKPEILPTSSLIEPTLG